MLNKKIAERITNIFIKALKENRIPWKKSWRSFNPQNFVTKKEYKGINKLLLSSLGFNAPYFLTFNQIKKLGGYLKKGSKGIPVVFWTVKEKEIKKIDSETQEEITKKIKYPILRYYTVFNIEQTEGIKYELPEKKNINPIKEAEIIISNYKDKPEIKEILSNKAYYSPYLDTIIVPLKKQFNNIHEFYSTLFHELVHSTGHEKRLNRTELTKVTAFGTENYSKEELIAEIGAAFLCGYINIEQKTIKNQKAYIQSWITKLQNNPYWIIQASNKAQKAVDYILGNNN